MKKLAIFVLSGIFLVISPLPAHAATIKPIKFIRQPNKLVARPISEPSESPIKPIPTPICKTVEVTPGHPLHLRGTGRLKGEGKGESHFNVKRGVVNIKGHGIVAVKASDNDTLDVSGFGRKFKIGDWVIYLGKGKLSIKGDYYQVVTFSNMTVRAHGTGSTNFRGRWKVTYCRLLRVRPIPIPRVIPDHLRLEVAE